MKTAVGIGLISFFTLLLLVYLFGIYQNSPLFGPGIFAVSVFLLGSFYVTIQDRFKGSMQHIAVILGILVLSVGFASATEGVKDRYLDDQAAAADRQQLELEIAQLESAVQQYGLVKDAIANQLLAVERQNVQLMADAVDEQSRQQQDALDEQAQSLQEQLEVAQESLRLQQEELQQAADDLARQQALFEAAQAQTVSTVQQAYDYEEDDD